MQMSANLVFANASIITLMSMDGKIGKCVSAWRRSASLSQEALAQALGTQQAAISKIEAGKQSLTVEQLLRVIDSCGISIESAIEELDECRSETLRPIWERIDE